MDEQTLSHALLSQIGTNHAVHHRTEEGRGLSTIMNPSPSFRMCEVRSESGKKEMTLHGNIASFRSIFIRDRYAHHRVLPYR